MKSWVSTANGHSDFPLQNLPFGVFRQGGAEPRIGVAIGDSVLDLAGCYEADLVEEWACTRSSLNELMSRGRTALTRLRQRLMELLGDGSAERERVERLLLDRSAVEMVLPCAIGDYTDFYASLHHATNVGSMFRPDNPLLPNYKHVPIGYHGRSSSIVVSGTPFRRPVGQTKAESEPAPRFGPTARLDYELEVGVLIGRGNRLGEAIHVHQAEKHVFGLCLVNDWSARDIQAWEYQPLGPFLGKNFATSISPWIVTLDALEPYRAPIAQRAEGDPAPLPYLQFSEDRAIDLQLEVLLQSERMRAEGMEPYTLSRGNLREMYWSIAQLIAHHSSNGCNLRPGDLLASGTVSGAAKESRGSLLERAWRGTEPIRLPSGEERKFLEDGDEVILRGWCEGEGLPRIGFGECRGRVLAARLE